MGEVLRVRCRSCSCRRLVAVYTVMFDSDRVQEIARNAPLGVPDARCARVNDKDSSCGGRSGSKAISRRRGSFSTKTAQVPRETGRAGVFACCGRRVEARCRDVVRCGVCDERATATEWKARKEWS
jgi:hypothetical protein